MNPFLFIALPVYTVGIWQGLLCFFIMHFVLSYVLNIVFRLAHVVKDTSFVRQENGVTEKEWTIHQVKSTADFATQSKIITWFASGLLFQVNITYILS